MTDAATAEQQRQSLQQEIQMLESMAAAAGNTADLDAAVAERQQRIASIAPAYEQQQPPQQQRGLSQEQLREIFEFYCNFGRSAAMTYQDSLDSFMFMKFARECPGLLGRTLHPTDIDLIFVKAKPKFERRLDFEHFLDALAAVAETCFPESTPRDGLRQLIAHHLVPHYDMVQLEMSKTGETEVPLTGVHKRLYDPRSYTGVYAERFRSGDGRINGDTETRAGRQYSGSTNTGTDATIHDVSALMRPNLHGAGTMLSPSNHLLYRKQGLATGAASSSSFSSSFSSGSTPGGGGARAGPVLLPSDAAGQSAALMAALARAHAGDASDLMALTVALSEQVQRMQQQQLQHGGGSGGGAAGTPSRGPAPSSLTGGESAAVRAEVEELEGDIEHLKAQLQDATASADSGELGRDGGGSTVAELTEAIRTRRHRIQMLLQGSARPMALASPPPPAAPASRQRAAPPSSGGGGGVGSASRGRGASVSAPREREAASRSRRGSGLTDRDREGDGASVASAAPPAINQEQLREVFEFYCNFGRSAIMTFQDSLDSFMFMKFAKECPDLMDRKLNVTEVDLIFTKARPKFERRLLFTHFLDALSAMAERKYPDSPPVEGLRQLLSNHLAPHYDMVQLEMSKTGETEVPLTGIYKKLYDPRSYTGVYAERFRSGDGRINGETDNRPGRQFNGSTNTGTDEIIHDISVLMRPNLKSGTMMRSRPMTAGGSPRRNAGRSGSPRRAASALRSPSVDGRSVASGRR